MRRGWANIRRKGDSGEKEGSERLLPPLLLGRLAAAKNRERTHSFHRPISDIADHDDVLHTGGGGVHIQTCMGAKTEDRSGGKREEETRKLLRYFDKAQRDHDEPS